MLLGTKKRRTDAQMLWDLLRRQLPRMALCGADRQLLEDSLKGRSWMRPAERLLAEEGMCPTASGPSRHVQSLCCEYA